MRYAFAALIGLFAVVAALAQQGGGALATFHIMRVWGVMGGAGGVAKIQSVELRMPTSGQNFVAGQSICFFDAGGNPWARFVFPSSVTNGASGASILVASSDFATAWAAVGTPDFTFSAANTTAIAAGADPAHPVPVPGGKVAYGTADAACNFSLLVDSVAYGTGYTGPVDFGTKFASDMPVLGNQVLRLTGAFCFPLLGPCVRDNSTDYSLVDETQAANNSRNNANQMGPIAVGPDSDGDGIWDQYDNCPNWFNPAQNLPPWTVAANDPDCDGFSTAVETFVGTVSTLACGSNAWPPDFNSDTHVNLTDVVLLKPHFNSQPPQTAYSARFDLNADNKVNLTDVVVLKPFFNKSCTP